MRFNEIFETVAQAVANKNDLRAVAKFHGEHEGETLLVDFSDCGEPFVDNIICIWSLQKNMDEEDWGLFRKYDDLMDFLVEILNGKEVEFYVESF